MASPGYFGPQRDTNNIVLYLSTTRPAPISVPFELQNSISPDVWATRIPAITKAASRYSKPMFERIWIVVGFVASLVVPFALYQVILNHLHNINGISPQHVFEARSISMGIFIGVLLFFFLPIAVWKYLGRREVNRMLQRWARSDSTSNAAMPFWTVKTPGVFNDSTVLTISLPPTYNPSTFHPNAYLPSYINGPVDADANYYYPYKPEPGMPRMSTIGNVPLYIDEKRGGFYDDRDTKV